MSDWLASSYLAGQVAGLALPPGHPTSACCQNGLQPSWHSRNSLLCRVTLSIFPGVLAEDLHSPQLGSWYPILLLAAYNCADAAGKAAAGWRSLRLRWVV